MKIELLHPADQLIMIIERVYCFGMTTTTGGNISICDDNGDIWITPSGIDKGSLTREDIIRVKADGTVVGRHKPSMELPFHALIYKTRPEIKAVLHAHPPALVTFSIVRKMPETKLFLKAYEECGEVAIAEYALPGSIMLGEKVAKVFEKGLNSVILENHGVVTVGENLLKAFRRFETLDFCARVEIGANIIGKTYKLNEKDIIKSKNQSLTYIEEFIPEAYCSDEREHRRNICNLTKRAYKQKLFLSSSGAFSQRLSGNSFVITPENFDRYYVGENDLVQIENCRREQGKFPDQKAMLHKLIYESHPYVNSIITAAPPAIMAFAVTKENFESKTIPESYIVLRNVQKVPFNTAKEDIVRNISIQQPVTIVENDFVIAIGTNLVNAFDKLEVLEYSAQSLLSTRILGGSIVVIDDESISEIDEAFKL